MFQTNLKCRNCLKRLKKLLKSGSYKTTWENFQKSNHVFSTKQKGSSLIILTEVFHEVRCAIEMITKRQNASLKILYLRKRHVGSGSLTTSLQEVSLSSYCNLRNLEETTWMRK